MNILVQPMEVNMTHVDVPLAGAPFLDFRPCSLIMTALKQHQVRLLRKRNEENVPAPGISPATEESGRARSVMH